MVCALILSLVSVSALAQDNFQRGVQLYQEKKFQDAKATLMEALAQDASNVATLTNLALAEFQLGEKGWAVGHLRRALYIDPGFSTATEALKFISPQLETKEIPHEILWTETLHDEVLKKTSVLLWLGLSALFMFLSTRGWVHYFKSRRAALEQQSLIPGVPWLAGMFIVLFFVSTVLAFFAEWDAHVVRATVGAEKAAVLTAADDQAPIIYEIYAGAEVIVNTRKEANKEAWLQVTYPGGLSGWSKASQYVVINSDLEKSEKHE